MKLSRPQLHQTEKGYSIVELLVVVAILAIMSTVALIYATAHKKLYEPDDQALQLSDIFQEARQRALTQRRTMRVEVNLASNTAKLYDENQNATSSSDDFLIRSLNLFASARVRVDARPSEIGYNPPELMSVPNAVYSPSVYTPTVSQSALTVRFLANGSAVNAGTNSIGTGAVPTGVSLHIWSPKESNNVESDIARCLTVLGATGIIRLWEFDRNSSASNKWKDSRRSSSYGS
ncbi:MAG: prepilin-type N-terminal cleavage/methylation domain-containing protein [Pyrinomonadaceae bacterium]|nr:prepilin-type N-terminal cleavage/methylation domain-containing protein [Pyrinomonadaceae bacterium]